MLKTLGIAAIHKHRNVLLNRAVGLCCKLFSSVSFKTLNKYSITNDFLFRAVKKCLTDRQVKGFTQSIFYAKQAYFTPSPTSCKIFFNLT